MQQRTCTLDAARRVAAMLDIDPGSINEGTQLPRGWHFVLLAAQTRRSALRSDGFPGLGVPLPDLGLSRLMLLGRTVEQAEDIVIGMDLEHASTIQGLRRKETAAGASAVVSIGHELRGAGGSLAVAETQTYLMFEGHRLSEAENEVRPVVAARTKTVTPDETLLFQYSALCFNSHKIHLDKRHARDVEGFPDLVVNGGLATLLLTEFLRMELACTPARWQVKHLAPLFCGRAATLAADPFEGGWRLKAHDDKGRIAVEMEVQVR